MNNTCGSPNTVRGVRAALVLFAEFLERNGLPYPRQIDWESRELKAFERERERDIVTEAEYQTVRNCAAVDERVSPDQKLENLVLLTFLRRCGPRVSEASWLDSDNLLGLTECRLLVSRSKTRSLIGKLFVGFRAVKYNFLTVLKETRTNFRQLANFSW